MPPLTGAALEAALKAEEEGRLAYCVTDQHGRSCNGGHFQNALPSPGEPGEWSPAVGNPEVRKQGYHVTRDPIRWRGLRVWIAELNQVVGANEDKRVGFRRRLIGEITPADCLTVRMFVAVNRPHLQGADLQEADLQGAYLQRANLQAADLQAADLQAANLQGADLQGAYLRAAYLQAAYLQGPTCKGPICKRPICKGP